MMALQKKRLLVQLAAVARANGALGESIVQFLKCLGKEQLALSDFDIADAIYRAETDEVPFANVTPNQRQRDIVAIVDLVVGQRAKTAQKKKLLEMLAAEAAEAKSAVEHAIRQLDEKRADLAVLAKLAAADGRVGKREHLFMRKTCERWGLSADVLEDEISRSQSSDLSIPETEEGRRLLLETLVRLAAVDGVIDAGERDLLHEFGRRCGLSEVEIDTHIQLKIVSREAAILKKRLRNSGRGTRRGDPGLSSRRLKSTSKAPASGVGHRAPLFLRNSSSSRIRRSSSGSHLAGKDGDQPEAHRSDGEPAVSFLALEGKSAAAALSAVILTSFLVVGTIMGLVERHRRIGSARAESARTFRAFVDAMDRRVREIRNDIDQAKRETDEVRARIAEIQEARSIWDRRFQNQYRRPR